MRTPHSSLTRSIDDNAPIVKVNISSVPMNSKPYTLEMAQAILESTKQDVSHYAPFPWGNLTVPMNVINHFLGRDTLRDVLEGGSLGTFSEASPREQRLLFTRIAMAGDAIFNLQHRPLFEEWLKSFFKNRKQNDAVFSEAFLAKVMLSMGYSVEFIKCQKKSKRPDIRMDERLLAEFKMLKSSTNFNPSAILGKLDEAVTQIKSLDVHGECGWVPALHMPIEWIEGGKSDEIIRTIQSFLATGSSNIAGVMYCYLVDTPVGEDGGVVEFHVKVLRNPGSSFRSMLREKVVIQPKFFWK